MTTDQDVTTSMRQTSGMGFWRLVLIVALGILLAQAASGAIVWMVGKMTAANASAETEELKRLKEDNERLLQEMQRH